MRLIFIRHAEPDYEHDSLTEKGWREAKLLARRTKDWQVDDFYVSPLGRARDTASFTLREHGKTAEVMDWLHEFQGALPDGNGGTRLCWDLMPAVWTAQPELLQPTGWENAPLLQGTNVKAEYDRVTAGLDALLATVQMPSGIPVATVALNGAKNAAVLAAQILAVHDDALAARLDAQRAEMAQQIAAKEAKLQAELRG